jgi:hypothetical protein
MSEPNNENNRREFIKKILAIGGIVAISPKMIDRAEKVAEKYVDNEIEGRRINGSQSPLYSLEIINDHLDLIYKRLVRIENRKSKLSQV